MGERKHIVIETGDSIATIAASRYFSEYGATPMMHFNSDTYVDRVQQAADVRAQWAKLKPFQLKVLGLHATFNSMCGSNDPSGIPSCTAAELYTGWKTGVFATTIDLGYMNEFVGNMRGITADIVHSDFEELPSFFASALVQQNAMVLAFNDAALVATMPTVLQQLANPVTFSSLFNQWFALSEPTRKLAYQAWQGFAHSRQILAMRNLLESAGMMRSDSFFLNALTGNFQTYPNCPVDQNGWPAGSCTLPPKSGSNWQIYSTTSFTDANMVNGRHSTRWTPFVGDSTNGATPPSAVDFEANLTTGTGPVVFLFAQTLSNLDPLIPVIQRWTYPCTNAGTPNMGIDKAPAILSEITA